MFAIGLRPWSGVALFVLTGFKICIAVFQVVYDIKCKGIDWKIGKGEPPIHLKLLKGLPGLNNNDKSLFVTVECFISEGFPDDPGNATTVELAVRFSRRTLITCLMIHFPRKQTISTLVFRA